MATKISPTIVLLLIVTVTSVATQTFQYSHGWTNGKRDGHKRFEGMKDVASNLERVLSPCQLNRLKYILEGKPLNDRILASCDYVEDEENQPKRYKTDHNPELFEAFV